MAAKVYTLEEVRSWTPERRRQLHLNAKARPEGAYIVTMIDQHGLALSSGGLSLSDPVFLKIVDVAWSKEGQAAALEATKAGLPALAGVDRLLQKELGDRYGKHDLGTASAGSVVAEVMRHLGYKEAGTAVCPPDCTARTGMRWM